MALHQLRFESLRFGTRHENAEPTFDYQDVPCDRFTLWCEREGIYITAGCVAVGNGTTMETVIDHGRQSVDAMGVPPIGYVGTDSDGLSGLTRSLLLRWQGTTVEG